MLLAMPLGLQYLGSSDYGIWLTIFSVISWVSFFDLGITNGLKNRLSEALSAKDILSAVRYLSTAYALLFLLVAVLAVITSIVFYLFSAQAFFAGSMDAGTLKILLILSAVQALRLLAEPVLALLTADHRIGIAGWIGTAGNILSLAVIYFLAKFSAPGLLRLGLAATLPPLVVTATASLTLYRRMYRDLTPSFAAIDTRLSRDLLSLGGSFFILQIAGLVLFSTDNLIILKLFSAEEVVPYNVSFRYFSLLSILFSLFLAPFWPVFTSLFANSDPDRIRRVVRRLVQAWMILVFAGAVMLLSAPLVYRAWLGPDIRVPAMMDLCMLLFALVSSWNNIFAAFLNGVSRIRLQVVVAVITALLNVPLSVVLASSAGMGPSGVMMATCLCLLGGSVVAPLQYLRIIRGRAAGIWDR
jgi:O-antigen/teichoic acid export membrane protein